MHRLPDPRTGEDRLAQKWIDPRRLSMLLVVVVDGTDAVVLSHYRWPRRPHRAPFARPAPCAPSLSTLLPASWRGLASRVDGWMDAHALVRVRMNRLRTVQCGAVVRVGTLHYTTLQRTTILLQWQLSTEQENVCVCACARANRRGETEHTTTVAMHAHLVPWAAAALATPTGRFTVATGLTGTFTHYSTGHCSTRCRRVRTQRKI